MGTHRFWNVANDVALADSEEGQPVKYALAILPSGGVSNSTHLQQKDLQKLSTNPYRKNPNRLDKAEDNDGPVGTFVVVVAVVWKDFAVKPLNAITKPRTERIVTDYLDDANIDKLLVVKNLFNILFLLPRTKRNVQLK